jgi:hypothetical protein
MTDLVVSISEPAAEFARISMSAAVTVMLPGDVIQYSGLTCSYPIHEGGEFGMASSICVKR